MLLSTMKLIGSVIDWNGTNKIIMLVFVQIQHVVYVIYNEVLTCQKRNIVAFDSNFKKNYQTFVEILNFCHNMVCLNKNDYHW